MDLRKLQMLMLLRFLRLLLLPIQVNYVFLTNLLLGFEWESLNNLLGLLAMQNAEYNLNRLQHARILKYRDDKTQNALI